MTKRNENIDLIKIAACIAVVGLHTFMPHALALYYLCAFAVPVFFMVNGYLLTKKFENMFCVGGGIRSVRFFQL